jgi:hypothetical protein
MLIFLVCKKKKNIQNGKKKIELKTKFNFFDNYVSTGKGFTERWGDSLCG